MAVFDVEQQRMCVRVVYDGAASAGKTTNLRQLADLFATQKTCELYSPAEMDGRTLYFDWLQIAAGMVCGIPLICQVITVPGQLVLTPRRRHLLATADVVVHVCDSDEQAVERALEGLALFDEVEHERKERLPLVIQANKQDQPGALSGSALLALLGRPELYVVEAIASDGVGVVDTFVAAVRSGVRAIQAGVESGKIRVAVQHAESAGKALEKLTSVEVDPEWAAEMMLEEAADALANESDESDEAPNTWRPDLGSGPPPALPTENVPTGFIWPAHTGRAAMRSLASEPQMKRPVTLDGEGSVRLALGEFVISTDQEQRFESTEAARQALVRRARERTQLGSLLAPETVLVAQPAGEGLTWLWTILPRMSTVAQIVSTHKPTESEESTINALLASFGAALVEALKVEATHGMALELSPRCFGVGHGPMRYLGNVSGDVGEPRGRDTGRALLDALGVLASMHEDIEPTLAALESGITTKLSDDDRAKLALSWTRASSLEAPQIMQARDRLEEAINRGRKAA